MRPREIAWIILLLLGVAVQSVVAQGPPGMEMPPPAVTLAPAQIKSVPIAYEYVGMTEASKTVEIRARVQGFLETRDFQEGSFVDAGTRLFTIDPRSFKADKQIAQAQVEEAQARLQLAEQEVKRLQSVRQPGAIAQTDLDQKIAAQATAAAAVRLAKAQLAKSDLELSYTTIEAPLTGFIGKASKEIGSLVDSSQNSLLATMQQVDPLYVSFRVSENDYLALHRSLQSGELVLAKDITEPYVEIVLLDGHTYEKRGKVSFEEVSLDTKTGTVEMRGTFENPEKKLKPGQFVKVHFKGWERPNTLVIPQRAVSQSPQGAYVYVVGADKKAERRGVKLGSWSETNWIILEGLKEGEHVIVEGLTKVQPGMTVSLESQPPAAQQAVPGNKSAAAPQQKTSADEKKVQ